MITATPVFLAKSETKSSHQLKCGTAYLLYYIICQKSRGSGDAVFAQKNQKAMEN